MRANRCCKVASPDSGQETTENRIFASNAQRPTFVRRFLENAGWIIPGAILTLLPKCPACVATYAVIGTGVGLSLSATTYLRTLLVVLCITSLLFLAVRRIRRFTAMISATQAKSMQTVTSEYRDSLADEETTIDRRDRIRLLTAALATQVALGAVPRSLYSRGEHRLDRTVNLYEKQS